MSETLLCGNGSVILVNNDSLAELRCKPDINYIGNTRLIL